MVVSSAPRLAQRLPAKRKKKNASAKQLRARKKARAAARAARIHPAEPARLSDRNDTMKDLSKASEAGTDATEAAPDAVEATEPVPSVGLPNEPIEHAAASFSAIVDGKAVVEVPAETAKAAAHASVVPATVPEVTATLPKVTATVPEVTATLPNVTATLPSVTATLPGVAATLHVPKKKKMTRGSLASFTHTLEEDDEEENFVSCACMDINSYANCNSVLDQGKPQRGENLFTIKLKNPVGKIKERI